MFEWGRQSGSEASITVQQEGVHSLASALWNVQEYEIFIDNQKAGLLNGYRSQHTCSVSPGTHAIYVRAYARDSSTVNRVYGFSQTLEVSLSAGQGKYYLCGIVKGPAARKILIFGPLAIAILLLLGPGPMGSIPQRVRNVSAMVMALLTIAGSWYGYSSKPGAAVYLREAGATTR